MPGTQAFSRESHLSLCSSCAPGISPETCKQKQIQLLSQRSRHSWTRARPHYSTAGEYEEVGLHTTSQIHLPQLTWKDERRTKKKCLCKFSENIPSFVKRMCASEIPSMMSWRKWSLRLYIFFVLVLLLPIFEYLGNTAPDHEDCSL